MLSYIVALFIYVSLMGIFKLYIIQVNKKEAKAQKLKAFKTKYGTFNLN